MKKFIDFILGIDITPELTLMNERFERQDREREFFHNMWKMRLEFLSSLYDKKEL